ncbi:MAG: Ig-like domain-containing protein [Candidatus Cloacimonetes bacterium]|nr:Ig-like domain-containing protein [Candidatus Cloacimonadota bacterium]
MKFILKRATKLTIIVTLLFILVGCSNSPTKDIPVTGISLDQTMVSLNIGESVKLKATILPQNATNQNLIWTSSNEEIFSVSNDGLVTALNYGTAVISVSTVNGGNSTTSNVFIAENVFTIENVEQWYAATDEIKNNGNNKDFFLNIIDDFALPGLSENEFTFGETTNIKVMIYGKQTISLSSFGNLLKIGSQQDVIIVDLTLEGKDFDEYIPLIYIKGHEAVFSVQGQAIVRNHGSLVALIEDFGCLKLKDNAKFMNNGAGVNVVENSEFYLMDNAKLISNGELGVYVLQNSLFYMSGGEISGHVFTTLRKGCSGVWVRGGTFIMSGGIITENITESYGGTVFIDNGVFTMLDGIISDNVGDGSVFISTDGIFNMSGGLISRDLQAGVFIELDGIFNLFGGTISENKVGAVVIRSGNFNMSGGSLTKNEGSAVFIGSGIFNMTGGSIHGNKATRGAGVHLFGEIASNKGGSFIMSGGTIYGSEESGVPADKANSAVEIGAALYFHPIELNMAIYSDGNDILPHIDGYVNHTDHTIIGR